MCNEINGYVAYAHEGQYEGFHCLSVQPNFGTNEVNFFRDENATRTYMEMSLDFLTSVKFDIMDEGTEDEFIRITTSDKEGNVALISLGCPLNVLLNAIEVERMSLQAPSSSGSLS